MRVDPLDALKRGQAKLWLVLVGINDYEDPNLSSLNFAVADCQGLATALDRVTTAFPKREILAWVGTPQQTLTTDQFQTQLDRVFQEIQPEDTFLFYFAGHGVISPTTQQLYLCFSNTQLQTLDETALNLQSFLTQLQSTKIGKQVLILDACHCDKAALFAPKLEATLHSYATQSRDFYALLSCSGIGQQSWECPDLGQGVFTHHLIEGLQGGVKDEHNLIDIDRLYKYVRDRTEHWVRDRIGKQQIPSHIKAGYRDIIIGVQPNCIEIGSLSERETRYRAAVWQTLKQHYPISPVILEQLRTLAEELLLPQESIEKIETDELASFERDLENYKQRAIVLLHQNYPHNADLFTHLQQKIGFSIKVLSPLEAEAVQVFQQHKRLYQTYISNQSHQTLMIPAQKLQELKQKYGFSDAVAHCLEIETIECLNHQKQQYRESLIQLIDKHPNWNRDHRKALGQIQNDLGFSNTVIAAIERETIGTIPPSALPTAFVPLSERERSQFNPALLTVFGVGLVSGCSVLYQQHQASHTARIEQQQIQTQKTLRTAEIRAKIADAKELANQGEYEAAISVSSTVSQEAEVSLEIRQLINKWANAIWNIATKHYEKGEMKPAIALLQAIPPNAARYAEKQSKLQEWQQNWQRNQNHLKTLKKAHANGEWNAVLQQGEQIQHSYWRKQAEPLIADAQLAQKTTARIAQEARIEAAIARHKAAIIARATQQAIQEVEPAPPIAAPIPKRSQRPAEITPTIAPSKPIAAPDRAIATESTAQLHRDRKVTSPPTLPEPIYAPEVAQTIVHTEPVVAVERSAPVLARTMRSPKPIVSSTPIVRRLTESATRAARPSTVPKAFDPAQILLSARLRTMQAKRMNSTLTGMRSQVRPTKPIQKAQGQVLLTSKPRSYLSTQALLRDKSRVLTYR
jgi:Caspase domain